MQHFQVTKGKTSLILPISIFDSASTTGAKLAGLVFNTASLTAYYNRSGAAGAAVAITLATATKGTWATGGFIAIDGTNMPGDYELHIPDAALATGADTVMIQLKGAANMVPKNILIDLKSVDLQNATTAGLTNLDAAVSTRASPTNITAGTITTATNVTTVNGLAANVISSASIAASALNGKGDWNIGKTGYTLSAPGVQAVWDALTSALTTAGSIGKFMVDNLSPLVSGTADAGGSTTTMVDADRTEAATDHWKGQAVVFTSGTNIGLGALITGFNAATDTTTFTPAMPAAIGAGVTYQILPVAQAILAGLVHTGATVPTVTTLTGHTAQTGDSFARIGALGAGLTGIPWNAAWDAEVESEVNDALNTAISELGVAAPTATPTVRTALMLMYMALRNKLVVQTSGIDAIEIYNDAGTKICAKLITDDAADYTEAKTV